MGLFYNQKASAEFFYLLWSNAPVNQRVYILASTLLITFQTGFIFSTELSEIYMVNASESVKAKSSIMNIDSFFNGLSGFFDIVVIARGFTPGTLLFTIFVFLAISLMINFSFRRFDLIKDLIKYRKSVKQTNPFILTFSVLMMNYDIVFFTLSIIGFNSIPCRWILVTRNLRDESNYLQDNSFDHSFYSRNKVRPDEQQVLVQVSYLNDDVVCYSNSHLLMVLMGVLLLLNNFLLKQISNKLIGFVPSYKVFASKFGNADLLYDVILMIILVTKTLSFIYLRDNYTMIRVIFYCYFIMLTLGYLAVFKYRPFYNYYQHRLKCFQILYLLTLTGFSILVRETKFTLINTEISTVIFMMLTMTILLRMNDNFSRIDIQMLIEKTKEKKFVQKREMLTIYYLIINYIKIKIEKDSQGFLTGKSRYDDTAFLINYLLEEHKKGCKKIHCFCKKSKITQMQSSMSYFKDKLDGTMISEALLLLDEMLLGVVNVNKTYNDNIFFCYINFLSNFMGRPTLAYKLLKKKMDELKITHNGGGASSNNHRIEVNALLYSLEHAALKNLSNSSLSLISFRNQLGDYFKKGGEMNVLDHILFLNKLETLKVHIKVASKLKTQFLHDLRETGLLKNSHAFSTKFFNAREKAYKTYWTLLAACRKKYAPLQLIFGYFVLNCCQDRELASKILISYSKLLLTATNLHRIFGGIELMDKEFSVVYISTQPEKFHKILYTSSNVFKWLGFRNKELLDKDLSILIPNPLKVSHKDMIKIENFSGKMLMTNQLRNMVCLNKEGYLVPIQLGVRMNVMIESGVQFCGVMNFKLKKTEACVLLVNKIGKILGMTESAEKFFDKGESFMRYNKVFGRVFKDINKVTKEKLFGIDKGTNYNLLIRDRKRMKFWKTYCDWVDGNQINILTKSGNVSMMEVTIDDYIIHSLQDFVRFIVIKKTKIQTFDTFRTNFHQKDDSDDKNLKRIFDYFQKEQFKDLESVEDDSELHRDEEDFRRLYLKSDTRMFSTHRDRLANTNVLNPFRNKIDEYSRFRAHSDEEKELFSSANFQSTYQQLNQLSSANQMDSSSPVVKPLDLNGLSQPTEPNVICSSKRSKNRLLKKKSRNTKSKSSKSKELIKDSFESPNNSRNLSSIAESEVDNISGVTEQNLQNPQKSKKTDREKIGILNARKLKTASEERSSSGGSVNASRIKSRLIEKIIKKYFNPESPTNVFIFSQVFLAIFFVLHILAVYLKDPIQKLTNQDIITQAVNVDVFSWEIWAQVYTALFLDICRATERGWFPSDINKEMYNDDIYYRCHYVFRQSAPFFLSPDNTVDQAVRNLTFPYLYDYNTFVTMDVEMPFYEMDYSTGKIVWSNVTMARRSAVKLMEQVGRTFAKRDYENGTGIVRGIGFDKDKDPVEELMRRANVGSFNKEYALRTYDFYEYLKGVARQNEAFIVWSTVGVIVFSIFMYFFFMLYIAREISWMRDFYRKLFQIEVEDLQQTIDINLKKCTELQSILQEEKVYENEVDELFNFSKLNTKKVDSNANLRKDKVRVNLQGHYFGFVKLSVIFAATMFLIIIIQYVYYTVLRPKASKVSGLVEIYILVVELWSSYATINTFFFTTVFWNNTTPIWGTDGVGAYKIMRNHIYEKVHKNLSRSVDYDLGNYADYWRKIMGNSCQTLFSFDAEIHARCDIYYDGFFNSNFLVALKGMIKTLDFYLQEWENKRNSWDEVIKMFRKGSLRGMLTQFQPILTTMYYGLSMEATNTLMKELQEDLEFVELMTYSMFVVIGLGCVLLYYNVVKRIQKLMRNFKTIVFIFPFGLMEKNLIMKHHLKRVSKGGHLYKV